MPRQDSHSTSSFLFPVSVGLVVLLAMLRPAAFTEYGGFDLKGLIIPLIQIIMFGMGATLSAKDFLRVLQMPVPIALGFILQYTVMPALGWLIARIGGYPDDISAGIILMGSVAGGVASNVATYLAGGNVPLSVSMTLCSTLVAPFATPLLMKFLAGKRVPIDVLNMMMSIANMIVLPVVVGLLGNGILFGNRLVRRQIASLAVICLALAAGISFGFRTTSGIGGEVRIGLLLGLVFLSGVSVVRYFRSVDSTSTANSYNRWLSIVSMAGICLIIGIITSRARDSLLSVGIPLVVGVVIHNLAGYFLGYWGARLFGLHESDCRTVSIEVGMQNAGMASGIAMSVLQNAQAGLAAVVFGPWMNISGALLAGWWKRRPAPSHIRAHHDAINSR